MQREQEPLFVFEHHVGELRLRELERTNGLAKYLSRCRPNDSGVQAGSGSTHHSEDNAKSGFIETTERTRETLGPGQKCAVRHAHVFQVNVTLNGCAERKLAVDSRRREPGCRRRHDETTNAVRGVCPDDADVGDCCEPDPSLRTVEHPFVTITRCCGEHVCGVGTAVRFGEPETPDLFTSGHLRQPFLLLLL